jgi:hypothetical protein
VGVVVILVLPFWIPLMLKMMKKEMRRKMRRMTLFVPLLLLSKSGLPPVVTGYL